MDELILTRTEECLPLRAAVLAELFPEEAGRLPEDEDERSLHLVVKEGKRVVGTATLVHGLRVGRTSETWRLRAVAVGAERRRRGVGAKLVAALQAVVDKRGGGMWALVPPAARAFCEARGFQAGKEQPGGLLVTWRPPP